MPLLLIALSILGLVPYIFFGLEAIGPHVATADRMLLALIAWSAAVLSFAAGVHWGLELRSTDTQPPLQRLRLGLAALALIVAWVALALPMVARPWLALVILIIAYIGAVVAEHRSAGRGMLPPRYLWLRLGFTVIALAMLVTVLTLRLLGQTIVL